MRTFASLRVRAATAAVLWLAAAVAYAAAGDLLDAIEYYYPTLDHYFVTAAAAEIAKLDAGGFPGWQRTGLSFKVLDPATAVSGVVPVCRFYGIPAAGLDSHFYSASAAECALVAQRFPGIWIFESGDVFLVVLPNPISGQCPASTIPIYRAWNNRIDSNHRYTTDPNVLLAMIAKGYIAEGYGPPSMPVAMCSPTGAASAPPVCTLLSSDAAPIVGSSITLTALCDAGPTSYAWTGCLSSGSTCTTTSMTSGLRSYTVVAANANGPGVPASVSVNWVGAPPPPVCGLTATTDADLPAVNSLAMLTASCSGNPTSYTWSGCASAGATCLTRSASPGPQTYSVTATNAGGTGPAATHTVQWQASQGALPGLCSEYPSILYSDAAWVATVVYSNAYVDAPAFAWNGVWVIKVGVPGDAITGQFGSFTAAEFAGPPTARDATLSRVACDFRPTDPTGVNGPMSRSDGTSTTNIFAIGAAMSGVPGLAPGQTYYLNVRNFSADSNSISCPQELHRCDALVYFAP